MGARECARVRLRSGLFRAEWRRPYDDANASTRPFCGNTALTET